MFVRRCRSRPAYWRATRTCASTPTPASSTCSPRPATPPLPELRAAALPVELAEAPVVVASRNNLIRLKAGSGRDRELLDIGDLLALGGLDELRRVHERLAPRVVAEIAPLVERARDPAPPLQTREQRLAAGRLPERVGRVAVAQRYRRLGELRPARRLEPPAPAQNSSGFITLAARSGRPGVKALTPEWR